MMGSERRNQGRGPPGEVRRALLRHNERIRDELQAVVMGIWGHIKHSGEFSDAANLPWSGSGGLPGKREYRRFLGDHVLTQQDVLQQRRFEDRGRSAADPMARRKR